MKFPSPPVRPSAGEPRAFTLVEMLISVSILALLMVFVFQIVDQTAGIWRRTSGKIASFQAARASFEAVTRKLSQATLNTYWDYDPPISTGTPKRYVRQSQLHFLCGPAKPLLENITIDGQPVIAPTHGVFFQAPLGYATTLPTPEPALVNLLNATGYFVQYESDAARSPSFLQTWPGFRPRRRYRLMEMWQPTSDFLPYELTSSGLKAATKAERRHWFLGPLQDTSGTARPIGENVLALIVHPKRAEGDPGIPLTADYDYDTRAWLAGLNPLTELSRNQLPPLLEITMVAIDEPSAARLEERYGGAAPLLQPGALFTRVEDFEKDLRGDGVSTAGSLEGFLQAERMNYRIFSSRVSIRQAKWSDE